MTHPVTACAEPSYRTLRDGLRLRLLDDACLALRAPRWATCRACEQVCPVGAIRVAQSAIELAPSCVSCARCAAVCPMGALALPGFAVSAAPADAARALSVDCWKVPVQLSAPGALRVPCLGGLSVAHLYELVASAGDKPVELLDRGWCRSCTAGGQAAHPAQANMARARSLLAGVGVAATRLPRARLEPLPEHLMPAQIPQPEAETKLGRRGFFSRLGAKTTVALEQVMPLAAQPLRRRRGFEKTPVPSTERERLLLGLALNRPPGSTAQPHGLYFRIEVASACHNHQLCASICPTGALAVFEQGRCTELMFDTGLCIGCLECSSVCPTQALRVLPDGYTQVGEVLPKHPMRLTSFAENTCPECARVYTEPPGADGRCPQCDKRRQLASSAFQSLFGARR